MSKVLALGWLAAENRTVATADTTGSPATVTALTEIWVGPSAVRLACHSSSNPAARRMGAQTCSANDAKSARL
ncbi:hypothetical protein M4D79_25195 [Mycolicibacterium novocastrense]|nr:hypothetical protein M4D79_25195 [Mycolicibacterium novocastrense]